MSDAWTVTMRSHFSVIAAAAFMLGSMDVSQVRADEPAVQSSNLNASRIRIVQGQTTLPIVMDFAKILTFDQPARTIIIGNPGIVDGTLSDEYTIVLTGKSVGTTNMIVFGEAGKEVANLRVNVSANARQLTTIYQGGEQQVYSCVDVCRPVDKAAEPVKASNPVAPKQ